MGTSQPDETHRLGRIELRSFLLFYVLTLVLQIVSTGSVLEQGSTGLVIVTAIHAGLVAATFWALLVNAIVATQVIYYHAFC